MESEVDVIELWIKLRNKDEAWKFPKELFDAKCTRCDYDFGYCHSGDFPFRGIKDKNKSCKGFEQDNFTNLVKRTVKAGSEK